MQTPRRQLIEGITKSLPDIDPATAAQFIAGDSPVSAAPVAKPNSDRMPRTPLTSRLRMDVADALKRASLERQLSGETPSAVQDILEDALIPWLEKHGYLN